MRYKFPLVSLFFMLLSCETFAQTNGSVKGKVSTSDNEPASLVTIVVKNTKRSALSGTDGSYYIKNLTPGSYDLEISLVGYETKSQSITVEAGKISNVDVQLGLSEKQLEEVIVKSNGSGYKATNVSSSLRLQTPILEAPQNIQIVTGRTLSDQQVISMSDGLIRNVSGAVRSEHWGDLYTNITSRGSQVQAFRNGFNMVNSYWGPLTEDMSFVDHVEFVKGPAGFMMANGDPSGLYNVVTKKPTGQTKGEATFTVGSFDLYRSSLDLDGSLSKDNKLLYRLNLSAQNKKSFRPNEYNNRYVVAPVISYQLDEKTKLTAEYTLQSAKMSDLGSFYIFSADGYATLPRNFTFLPAGLPGTKITDHTVFLNMQHEFNDQWKLTTQLAYNKYNQDGTSSWPGSVGADGKIIRSVSSWQAKSAMTMGQAFLNGDITTGTVRHRFLAGIDISNKEYFADWGQYHELDTLNGGEFDVNNPNYGVPSNGYPSFDYSTPLEQRATAIGGLMDQRYTGVYVQDELGFLNNRIRLTLAGRYTTISQAEWGGAPIKQKHVTPRVGLSISLDKFTSVYGLYDQAFIPQAGRLASGGKVQPITGNNIEFGIKRDWFDGKWNTTASIYRILKENELAADPNSPPTSGLSIVFGQKRSQGIEFDLRGSIVPGLSLIANYALTESKITKVADGITNYKEGDIVPGYAKHTANAWLNYKVLNGVLKGAGISAGFTYYAGRETYWDPIPEGGPKLPTYFKLDGGLFWEQGKVNVTANMFNILDKYLYSGSYYAYLNAYYWQTESPRNLRLSLSYRF